MDNFLALYGSLAKDHGDLPIVVHQGQRYLLMPEGGCWFYALRLASVLNSISKHPVTLPIHRRVPYGITPS